MTTLCSAIDYDNPAEVFGSPDDMKLRSCMTLFDTVEPKSVFDRVLMKFFGGKRDKKTLRILAEQKNPINNVIMESLETTDKKSLNKRSLALIGAICGDIIGSWYEFCSTKRIDFDLFTAQSRFTDDTVCSIAIADALMNGNVVNIQKPATEAILIGGSDKIIHSHTIAGVMVLLCG